MAEYVDDEIAVYASLISDGDEIHLRIETDDEVFEEVYGVDFFISFLEKTLDEQGVCPYH